MARSNTTSSSSAGKITMINPATIEPRHSEFTLELIKRSKASYGGGALVRLRDGTITEVWYAEVQYESHGDWYDMSHFEDVGNQGDPHYSWSLSGFNTYPQQHHLDIMEIIEK